MRLEYGDGRLPDDEAILGSLEASVPLYMDDGESIDGSDDIIRHISTRTSYKVVILGGGVTAGYACKRLVELGIPIGGVCMISDETALPYERPALTKAYL